MNSRNHRQRLPWRDRITRQLASLALGIFLTPAAAQADMPKPPPPSLVSSTPPPFPGQLDLEFVADAFPVRTLDVDRQGRIVVAGSFDQVGGQPRPGVARLLADGRLDRSFIPEGGPGGGLDFCCPGNEEFPAAAIYSLKVLPDDSVVVAGNFSAFGGQPAQGIARLRPDGGIETRFSTMPGVQGGAVPAILDLALQVDGRILAGGMFLSPNSRVARWLPDGQPDPEFRPGSGASGGSSYTVGGFPPPPAIDGTRIRTLALQVDGRILVGGDFLTFDGQKRVRLARLMPDGSLDAGFVRTNLGIPSALAPQPDGTLILANRLAQNLQVQNPPSQILRLRADGSPVSNFPPQVHVNGSVAALVVQPYGGIVIGGQFTEVAGSGRRGLARLSASGEVDPGFTFPLTGRSAQVVALVLQPDGKILVAGDFEAIDGVPRNGLARLHGGPLPETPPLLIEEPSDLAIAEGDTAWFRARVASGTTLIAQWWLEGVLLATESISPGNQLAVLKRENARLPAAGLYSLTLSNRSGVTRSRTARLSVSPAPNSPGSLDVGFFSDRPKSRPADVVSAFAVLPEGRIIVGGDLAPPPPISPEDHPIQTPTLMRWNVDGTLDSSFTSPPNLLHPPTKLIVQPSDGRILVAPGVFPGPGYGHGISRFQPDGTIDPNFLVPVTPVGPAIQSMALQRDGNILVGGAFERIHGAFQSYLGRIHSDGSLDPAFSPQVIPGNDASTPPIDEILVQSDDRILIAGNFREINQQPRNRVARLLSDGQLDSTFVPTGVPLGSVHALALRENGQILVGCDQSSTLPKESLEILAGLNPDGSRDRAFQPPLFRPAAGSTTATLRALAIDDRGFILAGGDFEFGESSRTNHNLLRLRPDGVPDTNWNIGSGANGSVLAVRPNADGSVYLAGRFTEIQGIPRSGLARLLGESPVRLLDVRPSGNGLQFRFETRKDRHYQVESIEAIPGSAWESMGEWFVGDGGSRTFLHPDQAGTARYFRVRTE